MTYFPTFTVRNWFWIVGGDASKAWSSSAGAYVTGYPQDRITRIASEDELADVLRPYGMAGPKVSEMDYAIAAQAHVDATAKAKGYADGIALAGYSTSTIPTWANEAATFIAWRDQIWLHAYTELAKVQAGQRAAPTIEGFLSELPAIAWPQS